MPKTGRGGRAGVACCPRGRLGLRVEERGVTRHQADSSPAWGLSPQLREAAASSFASSAPTTAASFFMSASRTAAARPPACGRCWVGGGPPQHPALPESAQGLRSGPSVLRVGGQLGPLSAASACPSAVHPGPPCPSAHTLTALTSSSPSHLRGVLGVSWELASPWTGQGKLRPSSGSGLSSRSATWGGRRHTVLRQDGGVGAARSV